MPNDEFLPESEFLPKGELSEKDFGGEQVEDSAASDFSPESRPERTRRRRKTGKDGDDSSYGYGGYGYGGGGYGYGGAGGYGYGEGEEQAGKMMIAGRTLQDYGIWYLRFSWLVVLITLIGGFAGYYIYSITPKSYESWARIEIERLSQSAPEVYEGERVRIKEDKQLRAAVEKLRLPRIYNAVAAKPEILKRPGIVPKSTQFTLPWQPANQNPEPASPSADLSPEELSKLLMSWVRVEWTNNSFFVDVRSTHTDPQTAKDILDAVVAEYEALSTKEGFSGSEQYAFEYILEKSNKIRERILQGEAAVSRYRGCEELSASIRKTQTEITELEKRYLPQWPDLIEARNRYQSLVERFSNEVKKVIDSSPEEKNYWKEQENEWGQKAGAELLEVQLQLVATRASLLNKDLQTDERILDGLLKKTKEADISQGYSAKQFAVVQPPTLPIDPAKPVLKKVLAQFMGGAFGLAILLVFGLALIDQSIWTVSDLESITGVPVVGAIPTSETRKKGAPIDLLLETKSDNSAVEALRTLRAGLAYLGEQEDHLSYVVTSALPSEGKSWIAANLAVAFAQQGDRTLLIDADLRRPVISASFGLSKDTAGLTDHLAKSTPLESVIHRSSVDNLWVMPAGAKAPNPPELLGSRRLKAFLREVSDKFDRIIVDSAPLLPVSDTLVVARHVQYVLVAYRAGKTQRGALLRALKNLSSNRTEASGLIANLLPRVKRGRGYAYGYYYSYYGGYHSKYYDEAQKEG